MGTAVGAALWQDFEKVERTYGEGEAEFCLMRSV